MNEILDPNRIRAALGTKWLGRTLVYKETIGSTNDLLLQMAAEGAAAGTVVLADFQTKGKGRHGRSWQAPPRTSLLFSVLFRPDWPAEWSPWLTMIAGLAAAEAVAAETGLLARLKWPNDIVVESGGRWRKLGGMLLDGDFIDARLRTAVLGTGLNVNIAPDELPESATPATSLSVETGRRLSREALLVRILSRLEKRYMEIEMGRSPWLAWNELLVTLGREVRISGASQPEAVEGVAEATDEWGRLLVRDPAGRLHKVSAGEVTLRS